MLEMLLSRDIMDLLYSNAMNNSYMEHLGI